MEKKDFFTKIHPILRVLQPSPKKNFWDIPSFITEEKEETEIKRDKSYAYQHFIDCHVALSQEIAKKWKKE